MGLGEHIIWDLKRPIKGHYDSSESRENVEQNQSFCVEKDTCSDGRYCNGKGIIKIITRLKPGPKSSLNNKRGRRTEYKVCSKYYRQFLKS